VDGRGRGLDVREHRRIEVPSLDVHRDGRGGGLVELECEVRCPDRPADKTLCLLSKLVHPVITGGRLQTRVVG
jgi:hypothetical protein